MMRRRCRRASPGIDHLVSQHGDVALSHFARRTAALDPPRRRALQCGSLERVSRTESGLTATTATGT
jgi:hypothetical protein